MAATNETLYRGLREAADEYDYTLIVTDVGTALESSIQAKDEDEGYVDAKEVERAAAACEVVASDLRAWLRELV
jgi:hypothetical protein